MRRERLPGMLSDVLHGNFTREQVHEQGPGFVHAFF